MSRHITIEKQDLLNHEFIELNLRGYFLHNRLGIIAYMPYWDIFQYKLISKNNHALISDVEELSEFLYKEQQLNQ